MEQSSGFEKKQLLNSVTIGYPRDLVQAVLEEEKLYTKQEAQLVIEEYLGREIVGEGKK